MQGLIHIFQPLPEIWVYGRLLIQKYAKGFFCHTYAKKFIYLMNLNLKRVIVSSISPPTSLSPYYDYRRVRHRSITQNQNSKITAVVSCAVLTRDHSSFLFRRYLRLFFCKKNYRRLSPPPPSSSLPLKNMKNSPNSHFKYFHYIEQSFPRRRASLERERQFFSISLFPSPWKSHNHFSKTH